MQFQADRPGVPVTPPADRRDDRPRGRIPGRHRDRALDPGRSRFIVSSDAARFLLVTQAAGFEGFIRTLGTPAPVAEIPPAPAAPPDMAPVLQAAADHGIEILGPPGIPA